MKSQRDEMMSKGIMREQTNDKFCQGLKPGPYHGKRTFLIVKDLFIAAGMKTDIS